MPTFEIQDAKGRTVEIEGDREPSESEIQEIFAQTVDAKSPSMRAVIPPPGTSFGASLVKAPSPFELGQPPSEFEQLIARANTPEEQALSQKLETPLVNLPKEFYEAPVLRLIDQEMSEGLAAGTKRSVEGMTSPAGLATLPYMVLGGAEAFALKQGAVAARIIAGAFGAQGLAELPEAGKEYVQAVSAGDKKAAASAWVKLAATTGQALGLTALKELKTALETPTETPPVLPVAQETFNQLIPESRRLMAPRRRMPEFTESTLEPEGPPVKALPAPGEATGDILLPKSPEAPRTAGYRIQLPIEPETAKSARQVWSKPIDIEAEVEGVDAIRQLASMTEETKTPGQPYKPPTVNVDLRQLERVLQRNTVSKVESWADQVIQDKMKGASGNPYLDPEFLAAAATKGAILFKRGVTTAAEWNAKMREQFGVGIEDALPKIYEQSKSFWEKRGKESNASEISKATTLGRDVLRVGEESRRKNETGMPVNESQPGVRTQAEGRIQEEVAPQLQNVSDVASIPATENGGRIAIIKPDGTAVVGGRIHADTWNRAIEAGVATDAELADGVAGFVKPDGTAWGVNGEALPPVSKVVVVGSETPKPPALPRQRPPEPVAFESEASAGPKALAVGEPEPTTRSGPPTAKAEEGARETATPAQSKLFSPEALQTDPEKTLGLTLGPSSPFGLGRQIKSFLKKHFTVEGHIPKEVYEGPKATMEGELGSLQSNIKFRHREFMDALAETYGLSKLEIAGGGSRRIPVQAVQLMDEYLKGRVANPAVIPPRIRGVLDTMRAEITGKSNEMIDMLEAQRNRLPANSAKAKSLTELIDKIRGNLDIYVHRSYKFFDSKKPAPDWYSDLNAGIRARAEDLLMRNSTTPITREQAQSLLLNWLSDLKEGGGFGSGKLGSKDLSIFMKRKVIDPEIRAVLGEYHSPLVNYAKSMTKMGEWIAKQKFLEETKRIGMGRFLFEEDAAPPGFNTRIAGEGSDTMSPLNGLRTTQEIADAFNEFYQSSNSSLLARAYLTVNAWTKIMATSHSVMTQARNLLSRPWMSGMAGHWQLDKLGRSIKAIYEDYAGSNKTWEAYIQKLNKLQVLGDTARSGELRAILKDAALQDVGPADIASWSAMRALKQVAYKTPMDIYRMSDELGNIFGFENERAIQSKIHPTWTPEQLDAEAARIVRSIYPVYSETPPAVKQFRKVPLVGPFVTFPYQMFRTTWNGFAKSFYEIRSTNPVERAVGYKRLVSQMGTLAATWALAEASKQMLGITTQQEDDFRRFQPPWGKNSKYLFTAKDSKTGEMQAINLSYMDPYSYISDPMVALAANIRSKRDFWDTFAEVGVESLRPWVSEQMLTKALIEARNGKTDSGREIVNPTDSPYDSAVKRIDHVLKTALPGTVQRIQRRIIPAIKNEQPVYGRKLEVGPEIVRELTGTGIEKFDFKSGLAFRAKEFTDKDRASEGVFHQVVSRTQTTTPEDLVNAYKESDNRRFEIWKEIRQDFLAAVRNGVSVQEAKKTMEARGVTRKDANWIARGAYDPMMISDSSRKRAQERKRTLPLKEINAYRQSRINASLD